MWTVCWPPDLKISLAWKSKRCWWLVTKPFKMTKRQNLIFFSLSTIVVYKSWRGFLKLFSQNLKKKIPRVHIKPSYQSFILKPLLTKSKNFQNHLWSYISHSIWKLFERTDLHFKGSPDLNHFIFKSKFISKLTQNELKIQIQCRYKSDPILSDIDFKHKMASVWTTLNILCPK